MSNAGATESGHVSLGFLLSQIGAQAAAKFAELLEPLQLAPAHAGILRVISARRGIRQQDLARHLGMFPSRLVLVLDEMEQAGLVERRATPDDRRSHALHLTGRGRERLKDIGRLARVHEEALCAALNARERATLAGLLSRIAEEQRLTPGVHPGFRQMGRGNERSC